MCRRFLSGVLIEVVGACLVWLASGFGALGWMPGFGLLPFSEVRGADGPLPVALLVTGLALMTLGFFVALHGLSRSAGSAQPGLRTILMLAGGLGLPMLTLLTVPAPDLFSYAMYGRVEAVYGANPYLTPPSAFDQDALVPLMDRAAGLVSVYGPGWQTLSRIIAALLGPEAQPLLVVAVYRTLGLAMLLLCTATIWAILGQVAPTKQAYGAWMFAGNPLCLFELVGGGHNDGAMAALILCAVWAHLRGRILLTIVLISLAMYVKWIAAMLLPAYLVWLLARHGFRWRTVRDLLAGSAIVLVIGAALYGSNWAGGRALRAVTNNVQVNWSANSLAQWVEQRTNPLQTTRPRITQARPEDQLMDGEYRPFRQPRPRPQITNPQAQRIKWWFNLGFGLWAMALLPWARTQRGLLYVWGWTLFAYLCVGSTWFSPWYGVWGLALAACMPGTLLARASLLLSATSLLLTIGWAARSALGFDPTHVPLLVFAPPLAYVAMRYLTQRWSKQRQARIHTMPSSLDL